MPDTDSVAKARIVFRREGEMWSLLSRKLAVGERNHGLLEMLGGHLDEQETPLEALIRELQEEEQSGALAHALATRAEQGEANYRTEVVDGAEHFLFDMELPIETYARVIPDPRESLGFELVRTSELELLDAGREWERLTYRTKLLFMEFGAVPA